MANDKRTDQGGKDQRHEKEQGTDSFPGNPNKQYQPTPRQQQGDSGVKPHHPRLHEESSVTDRTVRRSVIDHSHDDDGEIDRLKG